MSAVFSEDGTYRYLLSRKWPSLLTQRRCVFVMLNPSTADEKRNDPTINRCIKFAQHWDCSELHVVNLFALRATDPRKLLESDDPVGPDNDEYIYRAVTEAPNALIICAWGAMGSYKDRDREVLELLRGAGATPKILGRTQVTRAPVHPLYLPANTQPVEFDATRS